MRTPAVPPAARAVQLAVLAGLLLAGLAAAGEPGLERDVFHRCEHAERARNVSIAQADQAYEAAAGELQSSASAGRRLLQSSTSWRSLRLVVDYRYLTTSDATLKSIIQNTVMVEAAKQFAKMLRVVPVSGNLRLQCSRRYVATGACVPNQGPSKCADVDIPQEHIDIGVPNADVVLYVTANADSSASLLAYAAACQRDQNGRPIAGMINFNPNAATLTSRKTAEQKLILTSLHEITHVLAFSENLYPYYRASNGIPLGTVTKQFSERGHTVLKIVTPKVVQAARAQFGCPTLNGAELEDQGGSGTAGSHWEARVFLSELMAGELQYRPAFSAVTLALYQDTGWYQPDYTAAQTLYWGLGEGCAFATEACLAKAKDGGPPASVSPRHFCPAAGSFACAAEGTAVAYCDFSSYARALPSYFQYFSSPVEGGSVQNADFCPVYVRS